MFSRSSGLFFLAISLCVQAIPHHPQEQCSDAITTVFQTVIVTANAPAATPNSDGNTNSGSTVASATSDGANKDATATGTISTAVPTPPPDHGSFTTGASTATMRHHDSGKDHGSTTASVTSTVIASGAASTNAATRINNGNNGNSSSDPQTSLTLDPRVIAEGFANNGQGVPSPGQVASLTSTNNFINFCLTVPNLNITNGKQITAGSCNPAPMGAIPSTDNMPSAKFTFPKNFGTLKSNQTFTIEMAIQNMQTGFFVNADDNYFSAPQQLNAQGQIQGHSHVVIEQLTSLDQTTPTNPKNFVFFKGLNDPTVGGKLNASVTNGLDVGFYKLSSINTASNHQPVLVPIAQHGSLDDVIYFSVTSDGAAVNNGGKNTAPSTSASKSVAVPSASKPARVVAAPSSLLMTAATTATPCSFMPASTSPASMEGKRGLRNRFNLKI